MQDQAGLDLDGFPLDHVFSDDYGLEEKDEVDIDVIPSLRGIQGPTRRQVIQAFSLLEDHQRLGEVQAPIYCPHSAPGGRRGEVGEGEKPRSRGKTNFKKEDKRDAASIALDATVEGMMTKKDSRKEKRRQDKEKQMNAFMEIQRRRLEMEAEKQATMLEWRRRSKPR
ncbi:DNA repair protein rhp54 [Hordeum vulgare]|nr:DNA repair protein rhp54 [Hordeum vulgare]